VARPEHSAMIQMNFAAAHTRAMYIMDLILRELVYIVIITFGYILYCVCFNLYCGGFKLFCNVCVCVCVGWFCNVWVS
jgi:antibiotic biosynthesis monooxygenase (ABM) superfamily enzyme